MMISLSGPWPFPRAFVRVEQKCLHPLRRSLLGRHAGGLGVAQVPDTQNRCVYTGFRFNLGKRSEIIIFGSLLTTFEMNSIFEAAGAVMKICRPGVNFTNVLQAAFTHADPKSAKSCLTWLSFLCFWDLRA